MRFCLLFADANYDIPGIIASLAPHEVIHLPEWRSLDEAALTAALRDCDAVVTGRSSPRLPEALIADRGRLQLLAHCHGTVKHLLSKAHLEAGLRVSNWGDRVAGVAESAVCLLLAGLKQVHALDRYIREDWKNDARIYQDFPATLAGRDVGLYGFGPIGRHAARMLRAFEANVAIYDPYARDIPDGIRVCASLEELFATCQCISIHCGLNDATTGSVNRALLERLPQGGVVVNTARGAIVNEADLAGVLASRRIVAAVDVIENEKAWPQSPLAALPSSSVLLTGHVVTGGKGADPSRPPTLRPLPDFVMTNLLALAAGNELVHEIPAAIYDLKT